MSRLLLTRNYVYEIFSVQKLIFLCPLCILIYTNLNLEVVGGKRVIKGQVLKYIKILIHT